MAEILKMEHITKTYGKVVADRDVDISLNEGEILAVVGENGAGKSTLMKILYGLEIPDSGQITIRGQKLSFNSPSDAISCGIGMVQQHFMLFESMTVTENIVYNHEMRRGLWGIFFDKKANRAKVKQLSEQYQLVVDPDAVVADCPVGTQQRIEILKTLHQDVDILIFDEPSAVLTPAEVEDLLKTLTSLAAMGKSIILITHKLNEVMQVTDRVVVMRDGVVVARCNTADTSVRELSHHMVGRHIEPPVIQPHDPKGRMLEVKELRLVGDDGRTIINGIDIHVDRGEIVGVAGVSGNGQAELVRCLTGLEREWVGHISLDGQDLQGKDVVAFRKFGMAHIPEDRYAWGSAREATLSENALMGNEHSKPYSRSGILDLKAVRQNTAEMIVEYDIKAASVFQRLRELSGGNAQKLIAAREIGRDADFLVASEPTRGIDIGAMEFIHNKLLEKRNSGGCVLLVSSELSEIMKLSDRIYVIYDGAISGEFGRDTVGERELGLLMVGGDNGEEK